MKYHQPLTGRALTRRSLLRHTLLSAGALGTLSAAGVAASGEADPVATTRFGKLQGYTDSGVKIFKGIRYGANTASRRFQPALEPEPWSGMRTATEYGAAAPQRGEDEPTSEDCLFLNLWTPGLRDGGRRPIIFYIHGGGYSGGSGSSPLYDGINLCLKGDVVVVTVNHRLNAFGYLYLARMAGDPYAYSGNVGQLDLIQALQWVRDHAVEFGGDPNNVTVVGQSGGGAKIATMMAMPAAAGLFHKAVTMSGQQVTAAGPRAATQRAEALMNTLGLKPGDIAGLLKKPTQAIIEATRTRDLSRAEDIGLQLAPVFDSLALPRHPFYPDAPPQSAHIPMIIGNTRDETRAFLGGNPEHFTLTWEELPEKILQYQYVDISPEAVVAEYRRIYPDYTPSEVFFAATTAGRSWRGAVIEAQERAKQGAPTYAYQLDWGSPLDGGKFGAFHTLDIPLILDNIHQPGSRTGDGKDAQAVADQLSGALLALAKTGKPSHKGLPKWKPYSLERRETMLINTPPALANDPRGAERRFYAKTPFLQRETL